MLVIKEGLTREEILCEPSRVIKAIQRDVASTFRPIIPIPGKFSKARIKTTPFLDVSFP